MWVMLCRSKLHIRPLLLRPPPPPSPSLTPYHPLTLPTPHCIAGDLNGVRNRREVPEGPGYGAGVWGWLMCGAS